MMSWKWTAVAVLALLPLAACGDDDNESKILPVKAAVTVDPVVDDPAIFLVRSPLDDSPDDELAVLDVMLRMSAAQEFDAFSLRIRFVPGIVQFAGYTQVSETGDQIVNPFGVCSSGSTYCDKHPPLDPMSNPQPATTGPLCQSGPGNQPGNLFIGVAALNTSACDSYTKAGTVRLLTLTFIAASVGTSPIELVTDQPNDCEILNNVMPVTGVTCNDGSATITAYR